MAATQPTLTVMLDRLTELQFVYEIKQLGSKTYKKLYDKNIFENKSKKKKPYRVTCNSRRTNWALWTLIAWKTTGPNLTPWSNVAMDTLLD